MLLHLADVPRFSEISLVVAVKPEDRVAAQVADHLHFLHGYLVPALRQHWQRETETTVYVPSMAGPAENLIVSLQKARLSRPGLSYPRHFPCSSIALPRHRIHLGLSAANGTRNSCVSTLIKSCTMILRKISHLLAYALRVPVTGR